MVATRRSQRAQVPVRASAQAPAQVPDPGALPARSKPMPMPESIPQSNAAATSKTNTLSGFLEKMPIEILAMILDCVADKRNLIKLCRTSKFLYELLMPRVHRRVIVSAMHYAQIKAMIQTVEPYLSIRQRRELRAQKAYAGQQERYPTGQDEDKIPDGARFVRELVVGQSNPGKKHDVFVHRYVEEFVKNMTAVEVLEIEMLPGSVPDSRYHPALRRLTPDKRSFLPESLPMWDNLKSLSINVRDFQGDAAACVQNVHNLQHLYIKDARHAHDSPEVVRALLRNSAATLKTLRLRCAGLNIQSRPLFDAAPDGDGRVQRYAALQGVDFFSFWNTEESVGEMLRVIDFTRLLSIRLAYAEGASATLYRALAASFAEAAASRRGADGIKVRELLVDASFDYEHPHLNNHESEEAHLGACYGLLASFDQLESLKVSNYGMYPRSNNPSRAPRYGLSSRLIGAILKHEQLKSLKLTIRDGTTDCLQYPSADNLTTIIRGLTELEHIEFSVYEWDLDEPARCLPHGNFSSITCNAYELRWIRNPTDPRWMDMADVTQAILSAYLEYSGPDRWEDKIDRLRTIQNLKRRWQVSRPKFAAVRGAGKLQRVVKAAQKMTSRDGARSLWYREVTVPSPDHCQGYDTDLKWMNQATS
ncbi:hypothetical protein LEL_05903 [Akanthomyces lecanii RCEF 1005]|uniref:Uncharacterized protein n=1 Tax=Akanthomyces lecanii RCEF 1005 TaxID=1081108 RepID=A0A168G9Z2_CORDF|nr:hypothetical protein LEL_05903 [Akanthomyces lecanii RCEF 1005]